MTAIAELLAQEAEAVARLLALLQAEQQALKAGNAELIETLAKQKTALTEEINALDAQRSALVGNHDMADWLQARPSEEIAGRLWHQIIEATRQARSLHESNGILINSLLKRTGDVLGILLQHQPEQNLYSSNGQTAATSGRRILDSA